MDTLSTSGVSKAPQKIGDLFGGKQFIRPTTRTNERFDLLAYFCDQINPGREAANLKPFTPKGLGVYIGRVTNRDLYYIKSDCEQAQKRGIKFSAAFFNLVNQYRGQQKGQTKRSRASV